MIAVDTSVLVAAFAPWHESHDVARRAVPDDPYLPAHCGIEAYSVLTRLPDPFRVPADVASAFLRDRFATRWLWPEEATVRGLPSRLATLRITGGAAYDALVAVTAADHGARLLTLDRRAARTYPLLGVSYEVLGGTPDAS